MKKDGMAIVIKMGEKPMEEKSLDFAMILSQLNGEEPKDAEFWKNIVTVQKLMGGRPGDFSEEEMIEFLEQKVSGTPEEPEDDVEEMMEE